MECKKCAIDVPSQFEFALANNICPKCGSKLMNDNAMKIYIDLKKRLNEVELVIDRAITCERIAMFLINNYEIVPLNPTVEQLRTPTTATEKKMNDQEAMEVFKAKLASLDAPDEDEITNEEIRAEEAARAEEIATARELGWDVDIDIDEEVITGATDQKKIQRLKKLAATGQVGLIKRTNS